jgi:hypothetical protein
MFSVTDSLHICLLSDQLPGDVSSHTPVKWTRMYGSPNVYPVLQLALIPNKELLDMVFHLRGRVDKMNNVSPDLQTSCFLLEWIIKKTESQDI